MTTAISLGAASYRAGGTTILEPTTLALTTGEMVAVVGPNGAGKTTQLRLLGGELRPSGGRIAYGPDDPADLAVAELALRRTLLTHEDLIDIPLPARTVVTLGRAPHRGSGTDDAALVDATMATLGLAALHRRIYATLSGGERSLVDLARALVQATPIVLLDEPTASLDVAVEERTMATLRRHAHAAGRLVVAVVHDLNVVARHADRCLVMSRGRVVADGPPADAFSAPLLSEVYAHPIRVVPHPTRPGPLVVVA